MGLEGVVVQADHREDAGTFSDKIPDVLVGGVVKAALRQDNRHTSAGFQEVQVALDKENIPSNFALCLPV